jgi:hypothetical protein
MTRAALALCLLAAAVVPARAQDDSEAADRSESSTETTQPPKLNDGQPYRGVTPGGTALPPHPPHLPLRRGPQRVTWSGFQVKDGVPTVFVELTAAPDYQVARAKGELVVTLKNTVVHLKNNRRPLRVAAFNTDVTSVDTREHGRDTQLVIHTKPGAAPLHRERVEPAAGGFQLLVIELPASSKS